MKIFCQKLLRSIIVHFAFLQGLRFDLERQLRQLFRVPLEKEFNIIAHIFPQRKIVCVDVGANRGLAIESIVRLNKNSVVVAFEPNPVLGDKLKKRYKKNKNVIIHNVGLSDKNSTEKLYIPHYKGYVFDGLASFDPDMAKNWLKNNNLFWYREEYLSIQEMTCTLQKIR